MKNMFFLFAMMVFPFISCKKSSGDDGTGTANIIPASAVPQATMNAFNANFNGATEVEWQHNSSTSYISQFNLSNQRHEAGFDDNGHQSHHSVICLNSAVPAVVLDGFRQRFPTDSVYEWSLRNDGTWRAHFMRGTVKWEATYSATGVFIKLEKA